MASKVELREDVDPVLAALAEAPMGEPLSDEEQAAVAEGIRALADGRTRTQAEVLAAIDRMRTEQGE